MIAFWSEQASRRTVLHGITPTQVDYEIALVNEILHMARADVVNDEHEWIKDPLGKPSVGFNVV